MKDFERRSDANGHRQNNVRWFFKKIIKEKTCEEKTQGSWCFLSLKITWAGVWITLLFMLSGSFRSLNMIVFFLIFFVFDMKTSISSFKLCNFVNVKLNIYKIILYEVLKLVEAWIIKGKEKIKKESVGSYLIEKKNRNKQLN